jgi:hypothetical protein
MEIPGAGERVQPDGQRFLARFCAGLLAGFLLAGFLAAGALFRAGAFFAGPRFFGRALATDITWGRAWRGS